MPAVWLAYHDSHQNITDTSLRLVVVKVWNKLTRLEMRTNANSCILYFVLSLHACLWQTPPSLPHLYITLQVSRFRSNRCPKQLKLLMFLAYKDNVSHVHERVRFDTFYLHSSSVDFCWMGRGRVKILQTNWMPLTWHQLQWSFVLYHPLHPIFVWPAPGLVKPRQKC